MNFNYLAQGGGMGGGKSEKFKKWVEVWCIFFGIFTFLILFRSYLFKHVNIV